jgi:beta-1,2-mannobiose phosphorylase / 1,2-beta-oligomannan phosphorylase
MLKIKRYEGNPLLSPNPDLPWCSDQMRNPGAIWDGEKVRMLFTASSDRSDPASQNLVLGYAESSDGFNFTYNEEPWMLPSSNENDFDYGTVEDTRITELDGTYYIAYAARSDKYSRMTNGTGRQVHPNSNPTWTRNFRRVGLASTKDWKSFERLGPITSEHLSDANVAIFPEKINGKYAMVHRPTPVIPGFIHTLRYCKVGMWVAYSDDLLNWGDDTVDRVWNVRDEDLIDDHPIVLREKPWECMKLGGAGVPIPTDDGWLSLYHGVDRQGVYRVGLVLLDRENPHKVIARSPEPIMEPVMDYETKGTYPKCVFPCANLVIGDEVYIYYGGADVYCCLAICKLKDLLDEALSYRSAQG